MTGEHRPIPPTHALGISVVSLVLFLLCLGLFVWLNVGCASSTLGKSLNVGVVASASADLATTRMAIDSGRGVEANPFMQHGAWTQGLLKAGGVGVVLGGAWMVENVKGKSTLAQIMRVGYITVNAVIASRNWNVARGTR